MSLKDYSTLELEKELQRRGKVVSNTEQRCPTCNGKWPMVYTCFQGWGEHWHCVGCNKRIENCTCR